MNIQHVTLENCGSASGIVVVIDVLRAFTTAAYAFESGASEIIPVSSVQEAFDLRERFPEALIMGEVDGLPVEGFDLSNSPYEVLGRNLKGCRLIQRTSAGTQGLVRSTQANPLLASSLVCAAATARYIQQVNPVKLTFVITGNGPVGWGDEDSACADYIAALLNGHQPDPEPFLQRVRRSPVGSKFLDPGQPQFHIKDLALSLEINRFDFAMQVKHQDGLFSIKPHW